MPTTNECEKAKATLQKCGKAQGPTKSGKCFKSNRGVDLDAGSFTGERLAKAGDELVTSALTDNGGTQPLAPMDKRTPVANLCQAKTGMQLVTHDGTMALRLCVDQGAPGYLAKVTSAMEAKKIGLEFSKCAAIKGAKKCALGLKAVLEPR